ncbi:hypothetical protein ACIRRH_41220 [Kitasatospora sp. NPDC101235]|uniref:hypothetical protein n=1 Tax=Kitasatospora sp. NPDC101235 TaxID=3364101 RepID=UPI00382EE61D
MTTWTVLALCGPSAALTILWIAATTHPARPTMPDLPDDLGVTPATGTRPAILWARYGNTTEFYAVRTSRADTEPADHEEPQP